MTTMLSFTTDIVLTPSYFGAYNQRDVAHEWWKAASSVAEETGTFVEATIEKSQVVGASSFRNGSEAFTVRGVTRGDLGAWRAAVGQTLQKLLEQLPGAIKDARVYFSTGFTEDVALPEV